MYVNVSEMVGKTIVRINHIPNNVFIKGDELHFHMEDGTHYRMYHSQVCCENIHIEDIVGDLDDLVGSPLVRAEERKSDHFVNSDPDVFRDAAYMWTFYEFATIKGSVTIRWYGESNGYYSVGVNLEHVGALSDEANF
jgi:hypothetical protein